MLFTRLVKKEVEDFLELFEEKMLSLPRQNNDDCMNYPLISEYIEAIQSAEDNFEELSYLRPVLSDDGLPVMTSGNFAVVFKMKDKRDGKLYAVKCFTKEQKGRAEAYRQITEELKDVDSPYLVSVRYLDKELFVDTEQTRETEFPVLQMDWVEGKTLDKYLRENLDDKYALEMLAYRFCQLAQWLMPQPFAHGDLKPDNILVLEDGTLVLVDYDGMYVPAMKGQKARELGSPDFRHPQRTENDFDENIDSFSIVSILLSLKIISFLPAFLETYGAKDRLLFTQNDYRTGAWHEVIDRCIFYMNNDDDIDEYLVTLAGIFEGLCRYHYYVTLPQMAYPYNYNFYTHWGIKGFELLTPLLLDENISKQNSIQIILDSLADLDAFLKMNNIDYVLSGTLGLYLHGFIPPSYVPHDIDIRIRVQSQNYTQICDFFTKVSEYSMGKKEFVNEYPELMFPFYINRNKINAFVLHEYFFPEDNSNTIIIHNCKIKVHDVLEILREKYRMRRDKDILFNNHMQMTMNSFFVNNNSL